MKRALIWAFDLLLLALLAIWLNGGVEWEGKRLLKHGADLRRAIVALSILVAWLSPYARATSLWVRVALKFHALILEPRWRWSLFALVAGWGVTVCAYQALAMRYALYDVGIFHQILWSLAHGLGFNSTVSKAGNFLLDHLSPSLALLTPVYWLSGSSPLALPIVHPLLIFGGVAAWVWLAERAPGASPELRRQLAAATLVFGLSFDSLWGNLRWGFHENAIAFVALSWALALVFTDSSTDFRAKAKRAAAFALFAVAAWSKEILLVDVAFYLVVWAFFLRLSREKGTRLLSWGLVVMAVIFIRVFVQFEQMPHPADKNYFERYYGYLGLGLSDFFRSLFLKPWVVFENVGTGEILKYFKTVLLPWLGLPLAWLFWKRSRAAWLLGILPSFASALLATYPPLRGPGFHYVLELWPLLATLTILALAEWAPRRAWVAARVTRQRLIWTWALLALLAMDHDPWNAFREYRTEAIAQAEARAMIQAIPPEHAVIADELAGTWVSGRPVATRWPDLAIVRDRSRVKDVGPVFLLIEGQSDDPELLARLTGSSEPRPFRSAGAWSLYETVSGSRSAPEGTE